MNYAMLYAILHLTSLGPLQAFSLLKGHYKHFILEDNLLGKSSKYFPIIRGW